MIISRRPCALLKYVKHNPPLSVDQDKCIGCKACLGIGCPAISYRDGKAVIDSTPVRGLRRMQRPVPQTGNRLKTPKARESFSGAQFASWQTSCADRTGK